MHVPAEYTRPRSIGADITVGISREKAREKVGVPERMGLPFWGMRTVEAVECLLLRCVSVFWGRVRGIRCAPGDGGIERVCGGLGFSFLSHFFDPGGTIGGLLASEGFQTSSGGRAWCSCIERSGAGEVLTAVPSNEDWWERRF